MTHSTGVVITPLGGTADAGRSVAIQPDGKIVVAGFESDIPMDDFPNHFAVVRYLGDTPNSGTDTSIYLPVVLKDS